MRYLLLMMLLANTAFGQPCSHRLVVRFHKNLAHAPEPATGAGYAWATQLLRPTGQWRAVNLNPFTGGQNWYVFELEQPSADIEALAKAFAAHEEVEFAHPDHVGFAGGVQATLPNDNNFNQQWSLRNTGTVPLFSGARAGADIKATAAWDITTGDTSIKVGFIDSGIRLTVTDFAGRIDRNRRERKNNLDDDNNGLVDDTVGWNAAGTNPNVADDQGHGTSIASIIGANGNNAIGYAGVDWKCRMIVFKGLDANNRGFYSWWTQGFNYLTARGARVINISAGGSSTEASLAAAVAAAQQAGVLVVACMMNENNNVPYYPAAYPGVLAVGSTNPNDSRTAPFFWSATSGSCYGPHIGMVAPGNFIYTYGRNSDVANGVYWGGTSQAAPHVAAAASLLLAQNPQRTRAQLIRLLTRSADDRVGAATEDVRGFDNYYGHGRLNLLRALQADTLPVATQPGLEAGVQIYPNPGTPRLALPAPARVTVYSADGKMAVPALDYPAGHHALPRLKAGLYVVCVESKEKTVQLRWVAE